jgi:hypothetical protein
MTPTEAINTVYHDDLDAHHIARELEIIHLQQKG